MPGERCTLSGVRATRGMQKIAGAGDRNRTCDPLITNQTLYQLSYAGLFLGQDSKMADQTNGNPTPGCCI